MSATDGLESKGLRIPVSKLRQLANSAMGIKDTIPLWFGEPGVPTPKFICNAANHSMIEGHTNYTEGLGKPWLRDAISTYMSDLYNHPVKNDRIAVTVSGTNAVNLAFQLLMEAGDRVVTTTPSFASLLAIPSLQHAGIETIPLTPCGNGWSLDIDKLLAKASSSKILLLNSPNNPTGFMLEREEIRAILGACRNTGTWIISDEVYTRIVFDEKAAPSFAEFAEPEDRVIIINSFSKSWAMTGWRLGWLTLPPSLLYECEKLMEFSMSCAPEFVQAGGLAAIIKGEDFIADQISRYRKARDLCVSRLEVMPGVECIPPRAAFYVYFRIKGVSDSVAFASDLVQETKIGIAPGAAFDPLMQDWFRICFAKDEGLLHKAFDQIEKFLKKQT